MRMVALPAQTGYVQAKINLSRMAQTDIASMARFQRSWVARAHHRQMSLGEISIERLRILSFVDRC